jgi:hypothetical protein
MSSQRKRLEEQLTPQQQRAAQLLVSNEWGELLSDGGKKRTMQELADELGIARSTLYEWKAQMTFAAYVNYLAERQLDSMRSTVYTQLMKAIMGGNNGMPSVKAIDLFMRRYGLLTDRTEVVDMREEAENKRRSDEGIRKDIEELDRLLAG